GGVDERAAAGAAAFPGAGQGGRRAAELRRRERAGARALREPVELRAELLDRARVDRADDRDEQALGGLHRDADVVTVEVDDLVALEPGVQLRELTQGRGGGLEDGPEEGAEGGVGGVAFLD